MAHVRMAHTVMVHLVGQSRFLLLRECRLVGLEYEQYLPCRSCYCGLTMLATVHIAVHLTMTVHMIVD